MENLSINPELIAPKAIIQQQQVCNLNEMCSGFISQGGSLLTQSILMLIVALILFMIIVTRITIPYLQAYLAKEQTDYKELMGACWLAIFSGLLLILSFVMTVKLYVVK